MFRTGFLSIIRSLVLYSVYTAISISHTGFADCLVAELGRSILIPLFHPDPTSKQSAKPVWLTPIAVYTVYNTRLLMMERKPVRKM